MRLFALLIALGYAQDYQKNGFTTLAEKFVSIKISQSVF